MEKVEVFTDGACSGNPGPGGYAALVRTPSSKAMLSGGEAMTTNNRMEMLAVILALEWLPGPAEVLVTTDSRYVMDGFTKWLPGWRRRTWKTAAGAPVKNMDLWQRLALAAAPHDLSWHWVRGHVGHPENEQVDAEARLQSRIASGRPVLRHV